MTKCQRRTRTLQIAVNSLARCEVVVKDLQPSLEKIGRALAGGHLPSIAKAAFSHSGLRENIVKKVCTVVNEECAALCSKSMQPVSIFRRLSSEQAETFSWKQCISELEYKAPTLFSILTYVISRTDHRNQKKRGKNHHAGICTAVAVLLKERNREMCGVQFFISLVLFSSRVHKKVCMRVNVCALYSRTPTITTFTCTYNWLMSRPSRRTLKCWSAKFCVNTYRLSADRNVR